MTLDSDKVEQRYWQTEENQHKTNLLFKSTIQKNRKEKLNISKTNPYSKLFLCQFFSVFILSIVSIKCTIVVRLEMNEEQQNATLVGLLIKYIPNHIIAKHKSLLFRPINKDHAYLFYVQPDDGRIYVAGRIDREKLCQYKDNSYHHRLPVNLPAEQNLEFKGDNSTFEHECRLTMGVSLMKMTGNKIDIIEVIRVYIIVNDIDDNECFFTPGAKQTINLPEDIEPHTHINIPLYQPLDLDAHPDHTINSDRIFLYTENITNGRQTEVIPNSQIVNLPFKLIILPTGSLIKPYSLSLYLATALDYEKVTRYNLIIEANSKYGSRNQSCFLQLIIMIRDRNDHKPFFVTNYSEINIFENFDISLPIYTFKATDLDSGDVYSKIIYELDSEAPEMIKSTFYVNPLNGSLYLKHKLNYAIRSVYSIPIIARNPISNQEKEWRETNGSLLYTDSLTTIKTSMYSKAKLVVSVIDVNDHSPTITFQSLDGSSYLRILEHSSNLPLDFAIISVADEDDNFNGKVSCSVTPNYTDKFQLTPIITNTNIRTVNSEHGTVFVNNDGRHISKKVSTWPQTEITIYKLSTMVPFDREQTDHFNLTIECHDHGNPQLVSSKLINIEITDINDNKPMFNSSELHLAIMEDSDPQRRQKDYEIIKIVAVDNDAGVNSLIRYSLMGDQKITEHFRIDDATGLIQSDGNLDRETFDHYEFIVIAQDCGIPSLSNSITVKVIMRDYNDELPTFTKQVYEFHVTENNQPNQYVGSITCSDGDLGSNGLIHFQIESMFYHGQVHHINDYHISPAQLLKTSNNVDDMFMNTSIKPELPFELLSYFDALRNTYLVKIYAKDKIDREELLVISESMPVSASSPISPSFSVSSHSLTQKVYKENMKPSKTSDNMDNVGYKFWIVGEDQGQPQQRGRALVHVIVDDQNDNRPYFKQPKDDTFLIDLSYMERMKYPVYKVIAVDDDAGRNGTVRYEIQRVTAEIITGNVISHHVSTVQNPNYEVLSTSLFSLNPVSGILRLNKQFSPSDIDRILNVDIKAYDLGIPDSKHSYISLRIRLINSTSSESKDGFKFLIDEEEDEEEDEDGRESYTKWWSHLRLSMNSYIILLTVTASILLSIILMCIIGFLIKRKRVKQDSNKNRSNDSNGPVKYNPSGLLLADRYKDIDNSPIKSKLIPDDNLDSINSTMSNLLNEVPNNEITSDNITHTISYSPINYGTSVLHYADNHYNICSLSSPFSSDSQTTVLPQPFIVRLEPISTSIMDTNCIQPISILYPTHSTENFDQLLIHPISNAPGLTSPCFSYSSNINSIKRSKQSCCELNNPPNRVTTDIQARYDQTARNLQFPKEEIHLDQLCNYNTNSLSKPKTPEIQHVCFHSPLTKRHSLNSLGQDSGNGDSLETTTVSLVPTTRSVWVDGSMNVSPVEISNKQPVSLSFVHVITPLSSVKETDNCNNNTNSSDTVTSLNTLWYVK